MKTESVKEEFIQLRAEGFSFDTISKKISTSKTTLLNWAKDLEIEISNARALNYNSMLERYKLTKQHKLESMLKMISKIDDELQARDLTSVSTDKLLAMQFNLIDRLKADSEDISGYIIDQKSSFDMLDSYIHNVTCSVD